MIKIYSFIFLVFFASVGNSQGVVFSLDYNNLNNGFLTESELKSVAGYDIWADLNGNSSIVEDSERGKCHMVKYPKGAVGPSTSGSQFLKDIKPSNEYYLDYYVKFNEGFDFQRGGKLPGLTHDGSKWTGGTDPTNGEGWSARYMWLDDGEMIVYLYYVDMPTKYGEPVRLNTKFKTEEWYRLTQRIKINTVDSFGNGNGVLQVWVNGVQVVNRDNIRFKIGNTGKIDSFYFSTFHGGSSASWAPDNTSYISFDNIIVSTEKPNFADTSINEATSTSNWQNFYGYEVDTKFNLEFNLTAHNSLMDGVVGISSGGVSEYPNLSCIVRLNTDGKLDSYNSNTYTSDAEITYSEGDVFHVTMEVNPISQQYNVDVEKNGESKIRLATNYGFRNSTTMLDTWALKSEQGSFTVSDLVFGENDLAIDDINNIAEFKVSENLNNNALTILYNGSVQNLQTTINVYSITGSFIESVDVDIVNGKNIIYLNSVSVTGLYIIKLENKLGVNVSKLLKR
ncbi:MAG: hypothetical protein KAG96_05665 [Ichthyobacteriaceae bacterium]|nr:hypothetical protein [Ichthyobacteriaceae bacterium]